MFPCVKRGSERGCAQACRSRKADVVTVHDIDVLRLSIEVRRGVAAPDVVAGLQQSIRDTFGLTPEIAVLDTGTLAKEFEASVKTPRFVDRRQ
jgi:phenylacetate-CoA ligase